jgi:hypothetical protein
VIKYVEISKILSAHEDTLREMNRNSFLTKGCVSRFKYGQINLILLSIHAMGEVKGNFCYPDWQQVAPS